jgi:hypothetical protein
LLATTLGAASARTHLVERQMNLCIALTANQIGQNIEGRKTEEQGDGEVEQSRDLATRLRRETGSRGPCGFIDELMRFSSVSWRPKLGTEDRAAGPTPERRRTSDEPMRRFGLSPLAWSGKSCERRGPTRRESQRSKTPAT